MLTIYLDAIFGREGKGREGKGRGGEGRCVSPSKSFQSWKDFASKCGVCLPILFSLFPYWYPSEGNVILHFPPFPPLPIQI